jgi:arabinose-5-phosphate isomerase
MRFPKNHRHQPVVFCRVDHLQSPYQDRIIGIVRVTYNRITSHPIERHLLVCPSVSFSSDLNPERALDLARATLDIEAQALLGLKALQGEAFVRAVQAMLCCKGRVIVMGMGKSGHVGRKVAATLASTGTPAFFIHPAEASHGDLGMVAAGDVVLALSYSGENDELMAVIPAIKRLGLVLIMMTGQAQSSLARHAEVVLSCAVAQEACPMNLAPTASTAAQMALGDALAVVLLDARGFKPENFAQVHPGGALGRKLLMHVRDLMRVGEAIPLVSSEASFTDLLHEMSQKGMGFAAVMDANQRLLGVFTDGDLRRLIEQGADLRHMHAAQVMHPKPKTIRPEALAVAAAERMELDRITSLVVVNEAGEVVGVLNTNDLMRAKVI